MTVLRSIFLSLLFSSFAFAQEVTLVPGQVYTTPNVVQPTVSGTNSTPWVNGVYQNSLTCWMWGDPGYCGPNAIVRPGNNINFSFGTTNLYQIQSVSSILPNSGTGLRVDGYNFGFMAKNGNGWDNGQVDTLSAYVSFYGTNGSTVFNKNYNLNYKFDWTAFNFSENFVTPFASKDLGSVQYGFVGRDNNGWAGPYGPEIYNVSFSLKYSVDPCASNPLYSPTCPGYLDELNKLAPVTTAPALETTASTTSSVISEPTPVQTTNTTSNNTTSTASVAVSSPAPTTSVSSSPSSSSSSPSRESSSTSSSVALGLSIVARNQERENAIAATASQNSIAAAQAAAQQAQQEAVSVAASSSASSIAMSGSASGPQANNNSIRVNQSQSSSALNLPSSNQSSLSLFASPQVTQQVQSRQEVGNITIDSRPQLVNSVQQTITTTTLSAVNNESVRIQADTSTSNQASTVTSALALLAPDSRQSNIPAPTQINNETNNVSASQINTAGSAATQLNETYALVPPNFLTDRSNPINQILEGKNLLQQSNDSSMSGPVVNRNSQDNEAAGGVNISRMAVSPAGYDSYLNLALRDAAFYAPKEIYRNQKVVDNARVLRQLASDRLHQQMVDQQYLPR